MARNPEIQCELHEEIDELTSTLDGKPVGYEALHKMKFLDMVVSEGLRKWPPAPQIERTCTKDYEMDLGGGKRIPIMKGQLIMLPIYHLHRDPNNFPDPEKFDPHRFSDERKDSIVSGSYIPFGMGPRTCIGSRFALMEAKLMLFYLLSKFSVVKCDKTPDNITYDASLNMRVKETVYLNFKLRK